MRRTTVALLAATALALAGCSSGSGDGKPAKATATVTATKTTTLSAAEQRKACVDAWAKLLHDSADASVDDAPAECGGIPEADQLDAYMEGLRQRNQENRDAAKDCLDDPSCTALPVP